MIPVRKGLECRRVNHPLVEHESVLLSTRHDAKPFGRGVSGEEVGVHHRHDASGAILHRIRQLFNDIVPQYVVIELSLPPHATQRKATHLALRLALTRPITVIFRPPAGKLHDVFSRGRHLVGQVAEIISVFQRMLPGRQL